MIYYLPIKDNKDKKEVFVLTEEQKEIIDLIDRRRSIFGSESNFLIGNTNGHRLPYHSRFSL